jgi:hypothetical protein
MRSDAGVSGHPGTSSPCLRLAERAVAGEPPFQDADAGWLTQAGDTGEGRRSKRRCPPSSADFLIRERLALHKYVGMYRNTINASRHCRLNAPTLPCRATNLAAVAESGFARRVRTPEKYGNEPDTHENEEALSALRGGLTTANVD